MKSKTLVHFSKIVLSSRQIGISSVFFGEIVKMSVMIIDIIGKQQTMEAV